MKALKYSLIILLGLLFNQGQLKAQLPVDIVADFTIVPENTANDFSFIFDNDVISDSSYFNTAVYTISNPLHGVLSFCPPNLICVAGTVYTPDNNYVGPDSFYYYLEVFDNGSSWYIDTALVVINVVSPGCIAEFSYDTSNINQIDFTDMSLDISGSFLPPDSWLWEFGDGFSSAAQNPSHTYTSLGTYVVCLTTTFATSCVDTKCDTITIDSISTTNCTADFTIAQNGLFTVFHGSTTWIGATPIQYTWDFGDGNWGSGDSTVYSFQSSGTYLVCLTTGIDCPNTICKFVTVADTVCIDTSLVDPTISICPGVVIPVCGCDGITYNSPCEALTFFGVLSHSPGPCDMPVWPGDTDLDGISNNFDVLPIGLSFSRTGPPRLNASANWQAQSAANWSTGFYNVNDKHVDTDGSGTIDSMDINAIFANYGQTHSKQEGKSGSGPELIPNFMGLTTISAGNIVNASIDYGTIDTPLIGAYGLAYTIEFDPTLIDTSTFEIDFSNSWFNDLGNNLNLFKVFGSDGKIEIAQTRTNHIGRSGFGSLNQVTFVIQEDLAGKVNANYDLLLSISNVRSIDKNGQEILTKTGSASIDIEIPSGIQDILNAKISIYPNPSSSIFNIDARDLIIEEIVVYDIIGSTVPVIATSKAVDLTGNAPGMYMLMIKTSEGEIQKMIVLE